MILRSSEVKKKKKKTQVVILAMKFRGVKVIISNFLLAKLSLAYENTQLCDLYPLHGLKKYHSVISHEIFPVSHLPCLYSENPCHNLCLYYHEHFHAIFYLTPPNGEKYMWMCKKYIKEHMFQGSSIISLSIFNVVSTSIQNVLQPLFEKVYIHLHHI